ncbi:nitroreductase/quinone reductase family protein [Streptomyces sp. NPDC058642]|uniref:nitroreductase/quinone reductase family protein n=1 Tax=Streptomyces sp. NPDC058642 TaxID=3346572 RepID=UPI003660AA3B
MSRTRRRLRPKSTSGHDGPRAIRRDLPRRTCLIYGTAGEDFVVVASKSGSDDDPAWFKNLRADPSVGVQVGGRRFTACLGLVPRRA